MDDLGFGLALALITAVAAAVAFAVWSIARERPASRAAQAARQPAPVCLPDGALMIPLDGSEVFFDPPPPGNPNPVYQVTVTGMVTVRYDTTNPRTQREQFDALYRAEYGRFEGRHRRLLVNGRELWKHSSRDWSFIAEDRAAHRYAFIIGNLTARIGLAFEASRHAAVETEGFLIAQVTALPAGTPNPGERQKEDDRARAAAAEIAKREQQEAEIAAARNIRAREQDAALWDQVNALRIEAQLLGNWGDEKFQRDWARVHTKDLLAEASHIRADARAILSQTAVVQKLQETDPGALAANLGKLVALTEAERHSLRKKHTEPALRQKPKLTAAQVKDKKVRWQQIELGDKIALALDRAATVESVKRHVRTEFSHLEDDEQQAIIQGVIDDIDREGDTNHGRTI